MSELLKFILVAFPAVFFVVDPLGAVPIFLAITAGDSAQKRRRMAARACFFAGGLLVVFALFGRLIFVMFGISLGAFKVAGGILLLLTAIDMLRAQKPSTKSSPAEEKESVEKEDVALIPLGTPVLAGPGAVATVMVLMGQGHGWPYSVAVIACVMVTASIAYVGLRGAQLIDQRIGRTGVAVLERVMGLLLAAVAIQFMSNGVFDLFRDFGHRG